MEFKVGQNNSPEALETFRKAPVLAGAVFDLDFAGARFNEMSASVSWFRSGYLAQVAWYGYSLVYDLAYSIVREQIRRPEDVLIHSFTVPIPAQWDWSRRALVDVAAQSGEVFRGVVFGRYMVTYPLPGDIHFYSRVKERVTRTSNAVVNYQCRVVCDWPTEPRFGARRNPS